MQIFVQLLLGLNFLHRNQIDHRDIKPLNILMFNNALNVKIADFGMSKLINSEETKMSEEIGTKIYWAPELFD